MIVTLIGYRGCGKSSVAPQLAARLGLRAVDADEVIELRAGVSIREIFEQQGEPEFRRLERAVLAELLSQQNLVIAAGGGAILDADTRAEMRAAGPVVWLQAPVEILSKRIGADTTTRARRPSLTDLGIQNEIEQLLKIREPLYRETATFVVDTADRSIDEIVAFIVSKLDSQPHRGGAA